MTELPLPSLAVFERSNIRYLSDENLFDATGVRIAFTYRCGGVSDRPYSSLNLASHVLDDASCVQRNRELLLSALGAKNASIVNPNQVHGTNIEVVSSGIAQDVEAANERAQKGADALIVEAEGVAALLCFADCVPVILVSPTGRFAVVHSGWRGTIGHISALAARELASLDGEGDVAGYNAYIGPHIRSECFETSEEIADRFKAEFGKDAVPDPEHVDLSEAIKLDLEAAGFQRARIADSGLCTKCNVDDFYSYRAEDGVCGRHGAIAFR